MDVQRFPNVKLLSRYVMVNPRAVTARIAAKGAADIAGKAVTLVITAVAARTLVADAFGVMALAMATGWLLGVATDAGLSMHLARETARHRDRGRQLFIEVLRVRAGLAYVAATLIAFFTPQIVPPHWKMQFVLVVFAQLTGAVIETVAHYFRGIERSEIESAIHSSYRLVTLALALIVLAWWPRLDFLGAAMLVPAVIALLVSLAIGWRLSAPRRHDAGREPTLTPTGFVRDILPLGLGVLISALYFRIDLYFVERWQGLEAVGGYNAVFRLIEAMRLVPAAVMAVTFPQLVKTSDTRLVQKIGGALTIVGLALTAVCVLGATTIVPLVYGQPYLYTAATFSILSLALPLFFLNYALTHQVIGWDGQRAYLAIAAVALAGNVAANVALVPAQGMAGAAIATVLTELIVTIGCVVFVVRRERSERTIVQNHRPEPSPRTPVTNPRHEPPCGTPVMTPTREQELSVLRSVVYASLFDYPLTIEQLETSLVGVRASAQTIAAWWQASDFLQALIEQQDGLYFPAGRSDLIDTRSRREALSRELLDRDRHILSVISRMPFVRMVALSGSLAHLNAEGSADLDLFVITAPNRVWSVTVAMLLIARVLGWRKRMCLNYVVSERAMTIEPRDLFSANQIIHLRPIAGYSVFERFVKVNNFVRDFYPNFELKTPTAKPQTAHLRQGYGAEAGPKPLIERFLSIGFAQLGERLSRALYGWHLRRKASTWQSRDQVRLEEQCLKLHTSSHRGSTLTRFEAAMAAALETANATCNVLAS